MEGVRITKEGFVRSVWDSEIRQYTEHPLSSAMRCLREACCVDSGVTLGDIFMIVDRDPPLKCLLSDWAWCDVDAFHKEAKLPTLNESDLKYIELSKRFGWGKYEYDGETIDVSGIGSSDDGTTQVYAIELTPVNQLQHLPVRLNPKMKIGKDLETIAEIDAHFSLLDVLGEIYDEISFLGSPSQRDEVGLELGDAAKAIEEGRAELIPLEDILGKDTVN